MRKTNRQQGQVPEAEITKSGCGIRFNPEQLGEDTGFDFSDAAKMVGNTLKNETSTSNVPKDKSSDA